MHKLSCIWYPHQKKLSKQKNADFLVKNFLLLTKIWNFTKKSPPYLQDKSILFWVHSSVQKNAWKDVSHGEIVGECLFLPQHNDFRCSMIHLDILRINQKNIGQMIGHLLIIREVLIFHSPLLRSSIVLIKRFQNWLALCCSKKTVTTSIRQDMWRIAIGFLKQKILKSVISEKIVDTPNTPLISWVLIPVNFVMKYLTVFAAISSFIVEIVLIVGIHIFSHPALIAPIVLDVSISQKKNSVFSMNSSQKKSIFRDYLSSRLSDIWSQSRQKWMLFLGHIFFENIKIKNQKMLWEIRYLNHRMSTILLMSSDEKIFTTAIR